MMNKSDLIKLIPSIFSKSDTQVELNKFDDWFYDFSFSNGAANLSPEFVVQNIHKTRAELIFPLLDELLVGRWNDMRCLDLACHQGWFTVQTALRGVKEIIGLDLRAEHIEKANTIKKLSNLENVSFKIENLFNVDIDEIGMFDIVYFLGILYHIDNPLGALRIARNLTKKLCVIETQLARSAPKLECAWGSDTLTRKGAGIALIESDNAHVEGNHPLVMVPTLDALYQMLYSVGFDNIYLSIPKYNSHDQYCEYDRVVVFAQVI